MRTLGVYQLQQVKFKTYPFTGRWASSFQAPEMNFSAVVYGESGNGKTDFCVKWAKYLGNFTKVLYFSREEGISSTIQEAFKRNNMIEVNGRVIIGAYNPDEELGVFEQLVEYLARRNSPGAVFIDSADYMKLTTDQYKYLRKRFPRKAFIIICWSKGSEPKSQAGKDIEYMADIKIRVKAYVAHPRCRYGGNEPFIIWSEKARELNPPNLFTASIEEREDMLSDRETCLEAPEQKGVDAQTCLNI